MIDRVTAFVLAFLVLSLHEIVPAQMDDAVQPDTSSVSSMREDILEQGARLDDSPVLDFLSVDPDREGSDFRVSIRSRANLVLERSRGYGKGIFLGSPVKSYQRAEVTRGDRLGAGILIEKDGGETRFDDFMSGYVRVSRLGPIRTVVLGDYFIEGGQGIALWRGFDYGKGSDIFRPVRRAGRGIVPYRSADEISFLRGAAAEFSAGDATAGLFYSNRSLGASHDSSGLVSAFHASGLYRTSSDLARRDGVRENLVGFRGKVGWGELRNLGITYYRATFSDRLRLADGAGFTGDTYSMAAADYEYNARSVDIFGEWAIASGEAGGLTGLFLSPSPLIQLVAVFRHYPEHFTSFHGLGFGEHPATSNEDGLYLGMRLKIARGIDLSCYHDQFRFPGGSTAAPFPSGGNESLVQLALHPRSSLEILMRYDRKTGDAGKQAISARGPGRTLTTAQTIERFRGHVDCRLSDEIRIRARIEKLQSDSEPDGNKAHGVMIYEDVEFAPGKALSVNLRMILFRAESIRISELEDDLSGVLTVPGLSGEGARWYVLVKLRVAKSLEVSAKYSRYIRDDVRYLGSGADELPGNYEDRVGAQLDVRF